jgi:hypothetical protein
MTDAAYTLVAASNRDIEKVFATFDRTLSDLLTLVELLRAGRATGDEFDKIDFTLKRLQTETRAGTERLQASRARLEASLAGTLTKFH